jgi:hypothetical protein
MNGVVLMLEDWADDKPQAVVCRSAILYTAYSLTYFRANRQNRQGCPRTINLVSMDNKQRLSTNDIGSRDNTGGHCHPEYVIRNS